MTLKVIGTGFGRTGTESMKRALEHLGFGPCYHMYEVLPDPDRIQLWHDINSGQITPDWDAVFDGYHACVDWPSVTHWRALAAFYPDAKLILTHRSAESWYASMDKTILQIVRKRDTSGGTLSVQTEFGGDFSKANLIERYTAHVAQVQSRFGPDRLLTFELGSGWGPLCGFLGCPVPDIPFPRGNDPQAFHSKPGNNSTD